MFSENLFNFRTLFPMD